MHAHALAISTARAASLCCHAAGSGSHRAAAAPPARKSKNLNVLRPCHSYSARRLSATPARCLWQRARQDAHTLLWQRRLVADVLRAVLGDAVRLEYVGAGGEHLLALEHRELACTSSAGWLSEAVKSDSEPVNTVV